MNKRLNTLLCVILLFSFLVGHSWSEIYTWVDENGVTHFSNDDDDAKLNKNVTSDEEIEYSEEDQKKWEQQKKEYRSNQKRNKPLQEEQEAEEQERKQKCLEAKEFEKEVQKKYTTFTPEPFTHGMKAREKRDLRKRNDENYEKWKIESKEAHEKSKEDIDQYCH